MARRTRSRAHPPVSVTLSLGLGSDQRTPLEEFSVRLNDGQRIVLSCAPAELESTTSCLPLGDAITQMVDVAKHLELTGTTTSGPHTVITARLLPSHSSTLVIERSDYPPPGAATAVPEYSAVTTSSDGLFVMKPGLYRAYEAGNPSARFLFALKEDTTTTATTTTTTTSQTRTRTQRQRAPKRPSRSSGAAAPSASKRRRVRRQRTTPCIVKGCHDSHGNPSVGNVAIPEACFEPGHFVAGVIVCDKCYQWIRRHFHFDINKKPHRTCSSTRIQKGCQERVAAFLASGVRLRPFPNDLEDAKRAAAGSNTRDTNATVVATRATSSRAAQAPARYADNAVDTVTAGALDDDGDVAMADDMRAETTPAPPSVSFDGSNDSNSSCSSVSGASSVALASEERLLEEPLLFSEADSQALLIGLPDIPASTLPPVDLSRLESVASAGGRSLAGLVGVLDAEQDGFQFNLDFLLFADGGANTHAFPSTPSVPVDGDVDSLVHSFSGLNTGASDVDLPASLTWADARAMSPPVSEPQTVPTTSAPANSSTVTAAAAAAGESVAKAAYSLHDNLLEPILDAVAPWIPFGGFLE